MIDFILIFFILYLPGVCVAWFSEYNWALTRIETIYNRPPKVLLDYSEAHVSSVRYANKGFAWLSWLLLMLDPEETNS
jgi:hypothetical protein